MCGKPILLPSRHVLHIMLGLVLVALIVAFFVTVDPDLVLADHHRGAGAGRADDHPDRRRRHAGRRLDAQLLFGLGGGGHRLHAGQYGADHHRRAGGLVRRDPQLHHVPGDEPQLHLGDPRRFWRRQRRRRVGRGRDPAGQAGLGRGRGVHDEERQQGHHRAGLRHGGGAGAARAARDGRSAEEGGRRRSNTPSIRWPAACRGT